MNGALVYIIFLLIENIYIYFLQLNYENYNDEGPPLPAPHIVFFFKNFFFLVFHFMILSEALWILMEVLWIVYVSYLSHMSYGVLLPNRFCQNLIVNKSQTKRGILRMI